MINNSINQLRDLSSLFTRSEVSRWFKEDFESIDVKLQRYQLTQKNNSNLMGIKKGSFRFLLKNSAFRCLPSTLSAYYHHFFSQNAPYWSLAVCMNRTSLRISNIAAALFILKIKRTVSTLIHWNSRKPTIV